MSISGNKTLTHLHTAAQTTPDKPAFYEPGGVSLSWAQLQATAYAVAASVCAHISAEAREQDLPVVILADRSAESAAAILGAMAAGVWYVPIDPELPAERISHYLAVCQPALILTRSGLDAHFDFSRYPVIDTGNVPPAPDFVPVGRTARAPAFGIFTSGSTGMPKLVVKSRFAIESFIEVYCRTFGFGNDEIFGNQIPFFFDASTKDIFASVFLGATTVILPPRCFSFPLELMQTVEAENVSTVVWVPSVLKSVAMFGVLEAVRPRALRRVLFVGERMPVKYLNKWMDALPGVEFVNLYGSTEVAGNSCYYPVTRRFDSTEILPVGRPFDGTRVFLIDPESGACADEGEICVAGEGLAEGYYRDPEKTAAAFTDACLPGFCGRIYRSGDFGTKNEAGEFVCISRRDGQIKYLGHRIELGDIEVAAASLAYIRAACCFFDPEKQKIILCAAADPACKQKLREDLAALLQDYMLPHKYLFLNDFPLNPNGKTDRVKLRTLCGL